MIDKDKTLTDAVEAALAGMDWLKPSDDALVQLVRKYAAVLDDSSAPGADPAVAVKALYLAPHMTRALEQLGGTPTARGEFREKAAEEGRPADPVAETLARLQDRARGVTGPVAEEDGEEEAEPVAALEAAGPSRPGRARRRTR